MKLNMWNIYYALNEPEMHAMIKEGSNTICSVRLIASSFLEDNAAYVGNASDFLSSTEAGSIIVHRYDMIFVKNVDIAELFNKIARILDSFQQWEEKLRQLVLSSDGLQKMLDISDEILGLPGYVYAPDGHALAITWQYPSSIHWDWKEIIENDGLTPEKLQFLNRKLNLTRVFQDTYPTVRTTLYGDNKQSVSYVHCNLIVNGYTAGHLVFFDYIKNFNPGIENLVDTLIFHMNKYIKRNYEYFNPTSKLSDILNHLLTEDKQISERVELMMEIMGWKHTDQYCFFVLNENAEKEPVLLKKTSQQISEGLVSSITVNINNQIVVLMNCGRSDDCQKNIKQSLKKISSLAENFICGVSCYFQDLKKCKQYYNQAKEEVKRSMETHQKISYATENSTEYFGKILKKDPIAFTYINASLIYLKTYDQINHTCYYETIKAWFGTGFHMTETAKLLKIHRNSLSYRMERIRELIDFSDFDELVQNHEQKKLYAIGISFLLLDNMKI